MPNLPESPPPRLPVLPPPQYSSRSRSLSEQRSWRTRSFWSWVGLLTQAGLLFFLIVGCGLVYYGFKIAAFYQARADQIDLKKLDDVSVTSTICDINGEEMGRIFTEDRILLTPAEIPETMRQAVLAAEDRRYYKHGAIDFWGIARAALQDLLHHGRIKQGGSTIEQQLAKHLIGDFSRSFDSHTVDRKLLELFVAERLEQKLSKDEILNYYMNRIFFGRVYFGVGAAARGYFGKEVKDLTVPECALLAGVIRSPLATRTNLALVKERRDFTLKQMASEGYISQEDAARYEEEAVHLLPSKDSGLRSFVMTAILRELNQIFTRRGSDEIPQGMTVQTNLDLQLQRQVEDILKNKLVDLETERNQAALSIGPTGVNGSPGSSAAQGGAGDLLDQPFLPSSKIAGQTSGSASLQGAMLLADPGTGRVLVYTAGRDFEKNAYDYISQAKRECGAVLQPLVYALAFDKLGFSPGTMVNADYLDPAEPTDDPEDLNVGSPLVAPFKRYMSVQDALTVGNHSVFTRVGLKLSPLEMTEWFHRAGLSNARVPDEKPGEFVPDPLSVTDVTSLYEILWNHGIRKSFKFIHTIRSRTGELLYSDDQSFSPRNLSPSLPALMPTSTGQMTLTLVRALRNSSLHHLFSDAGLESEVAGMAGHADGYRNSWFAGYSPNWIGTVWLGYDDSRPIGTRETVEPAAASIWARAMALVEQREGKAASFPVPPSLQKVDINKNTGAWRGWPGMAPDPNGTFVYLTQGQIEALCQPIGNLSPGSQGAPTSAQGTPAAASAPLQDWMTGLATFFTDANEVRSATNPMLSEENGENVIPRVAELKMPGIRGNILGEDGTVYASTTGEKNLVLNWPGSEQAQEEGDVLSWMQERIDRAASVLGIKLQVGQEDLHKAFRFQRFQPFSVWEDLDPKQVALVDQASLLSKGFSVQTVPMRIYPQGTQLAHLLGSLSREKRRSKGRYLADDVLYDRYKGASGLEQVYNHDLEGDDGLFQVKTSADGYAESGAAVKPATQGNSLRLTINPAFQAAAESAILERLDKNDGHEFTDKERLGAVVIQDVSNGNVVVFLSHPNYDPNAFVPRISPDLWNGLNNDPLHPLICRAYQAQYPPGSCFKTVTTLAAMREGVFDENMVVHCTGYFTVGEKTYKFPEDKGQDFKFGEAYSHSSDTYFMTLGLKVGRDVLLDTARSMGLGSPSKIGLPGELPGAVPDSYSFRQIHSRDFGPGDVANTSIGQGDLLVTPIQMSGLMMGVANNGIIYRPRLVDRVEDPSGKVVRTEPVEILRHFEMDEKTSQPLKAAMEAVIDNGTAYMVHRSDLRIAAKTGTAQVGSKEKPRQIAWLCGFLPADAPKYSFAIMIEGTEKDNIGTGVDSGLLGGRDAGLVAKLIFKAMYPPPSAPAPPKVASVAATDKVKSSAEKIQASGKGE